MGAQPRSASPFVFSHDYPRQQNAPNGDVEIVIFIVKAAKLVALNTFITSPSSSTRGQGMHRRQTEFDFAGSLYPLCVFVVGGGCFLFFHFSLFTRASERANGFGIPEMLRWWSVPSFPHSLPSSFSQDYPSANTPAAAAAAPIPSM